MLQDLELAGVTAGCGHFLLLDHILLFLLDPLDPLPLLGRPSSGGRIGSGADGQTLGDR